MVSAYRWGHAGAEAWRRAGRAVKTSRGRSDGRRWRAGGDGRAGAGQDSGRLRAFAAVGRGWGSVRTTLWRRCSRKVVGSSSGCYTPCRRPRAVLFRILTGCQY